MKETKLEYIKRKFRWGIYEAKYRIRDIYNALFFGYYIRANNRDSIYYWNKINKKCYGADNSKEFIQIVYDIYVNTGTILNPKFQFFCDSSCKSDAIAKVKAFKKNKPLNTTCKNELMFTNKNTKDFHHFLLQESEE